MSAKNKETPYTRLAITKAESSQEVIAKQDKSTLYWQAGKFLIAAIPAVSLTILNDKVDNKNNLAWKILIPTLTAISMYFSGKNYLIGGLETLLNSFGYCYRRVMRLQANLKFDMNTLIALSCLNSFGYSLLITTGAVEDDRGSMYAAPLYLLAAMNLAQLVKNLIHSKIINHYQSSLVTLASFKPEKTKRLSLEKKAVQTIDAATIKTNDYLVMEPNAIFPVDVVLIDDAAVTINDQALTTGESGDIQCNKGDIVAAGSCYVASKPLLVRAICDDGMSSLDKLFQIMHSLHGQTDFNRLVDRIATTFVPFIMVNAILSGIIWGVIKNWQLAIRVSGNMITAACPCALGIADSVVFSILRKVASQYGIYFNKEMVLSRLGQIDTWVFDKTGTLTDKGVAKFDLLVQKDSDADVTFHRFETDENGSLKSRGVDQSALLKQHKNEVLALLKLVQTQRLRDYPNDSYAKAFLQLASNIDLKNIEMVEYHNQSNGLVAKVKQKFIHLDGMQTNFQQKSVVLGNAQLLEDCDYYDDLPEGDVFMLVDGHLMASFTFTEKLRSGAKQVIDNLKTSLGSVVMLTGDNQEAARNIARQLNLNVNEVLAEQTPLKKKNYLEEQVQLGKRIAMLGDGPNDLAAALVAENNDGVSISIGKKPLTSDVFGIHLRDLSDLEKLPALCKATYRKQQQTLGFALFYNSSMFLLAAIISPAFEWEVANVYFAVGMAFSSVVALAWASTLLLAILPILKNSFTKVKGKNARVTTYGAIADSEASISMPVCFFAKEERLSSESKSDQSKSVDNYNIKKQPVTTQFKAMFSIVVPCNACPSKIRAILTTEYSKANVIASTERPQGYTYPTSIDYSYSCHSKEAANALAKNLKEKLKSFNNNLEIVIKEFNDNEQTLLTDEKDADALTLFANCRF